MSNPTIAPSTVQTLATGEQRYAWQLPSVTNAGREIDFDLTLASMQLGEQRPVSTDAHLSFTNTFTGGIETAPIVVPVVTASAFLSLGVGTDRLSYLANATVDITGVVGNSGASAQRRFGQVRHRRCRQRRRDEHGHGHLHGTGDQRVGQRAVDLEHRYDSGRRLRGDCDALRFGGPPSDHRACGLLRSLPAPVRNAYARSAAVTTDKQTYLGYDRVLINARVQKPGAELHLRQSHGHRNGHGQRRQHRFTASQPLAQLLPNAIRDLRVPANAQQCAPGRL